MDITHYNLDAFNALLRLRRNHGPKHKISWRAVGLGAVIASFANKDTGEAWPSRATLSAITGIELRDISRITAELVDVGFLIIEEREGRANVYRLTLGGITHGENNQGSICHPWVNHPSTLGENTSKPLGDLPNHNNEEQTSNNETTTSRYFVSSIPKEKPKGKSFPQGNQTPPPTPAPAAKPGKRKARLKPNQHPAWLLWLRVNRDAGQPIPLEEKASLAAAGKLAEQISDPVEDDAGQWIQRMLAVHLCDWAMVMQPEDDRDDTLRRVADRKLAALEENRAHVAEWHENIFENPRLPVDDGSGALVVRDVHYRDALLFLEGIADVCDLVGLDCLSQISFSEDGRDYVGQGEFMRGVVGVAASTGAHIILVGHNGKGGANRDPLDGIQGSSLFNRLAHNVITLTRSDPPIESEVFSRFDPMVEHRLTLSMLKSRGGMSGDKIAMDLDPNGPRFIEHGRIKSMARGRK